MAQLRLKAVTYGHKSQSDREARHASCFHEEITEHTFRQSVLVSNWWFQESLFYTSVCLYKKVEVSPEGAVSLINVQVRVWRLQVRKSKTVERWSQEEVIWADLCSLQLISALPVSDWSSAAWCQVVTRKHLQNKNVVTPSWLWQSHGSAELKWFSTLLQVPVCS